MSALIRQQMRIKILRRSRSLALVLPLWLLGNGGDPGVLLELDRAAYRVVARDLKGGASGPALRVAVGSPAHPTPTGNFPLRQVVHNPGWSPDSAAPRAGGGVELPSGEGPLGVAEIPFLGAYALHGGLRPPLLGKPNTLGCLRSADPQLAELLAWLEQRGALATEESLSSGEWRQPFVRPTRLVIY
ncbi:MAG: L,D-transpeptidase [Deltaproteobacteria bacterium]|nr:L,D-transpeptidase [Deltaproteobacteria bacterium]MBW2361016.1 L,D-transpeptidase [Deltaproteobacteria bacterium]